MAIGLALGALAYWGANRLVERATGKRRRGPSSHGQDADAGPALALGALLDRIPEEAGDVAGLLTVLGFAVAAALSAIS